MVRETFSQLLYKTLTRRNQGDSLWLALKKATKFHVMSYEGQKSLGGSLGADSIPGPLIDIT